MMQDAYYVFGDNEVTCYRLSLSIDKVGTVPVKYPEDDAAGRQNRAHRGEGPNPFGEHFWRDGRYDTPIAVTLGERTTFFIPDGSSKVWSCSMPAIKLPDSAVPAGGVVETSTTLGAVPNVVVAGTPLKAKLTIPTGTKATLVNPPSGARLRLTAPLLGRRLRTTSANM